MVKLSAVQLMSVPDVSINLAYIDTQLAKLAAQYADVEQHLVVLPECCLFFGGQDQQQLQVAQHSFADQSLKNALSALAKKHQLYLVAGSIPIYVPEANKFTNTSCFFSATGELLNQYDKIHLFDVNVDDNERCYRESRYTQAGKHSSVTPLAFATIGMTVCYDLRFPELFRQLTRDGATIICLPAAFTQVTGQAHWLPLIQARAIENQVYIIAAGQQGVHANGRETWGHSMIVDPWGRVLSTISEGLGTISADYSYQVVQQVRADIPVAEHNQFITQLKNSG